MSASLFVVAAAWSALGLVVIALAPEENVRPDDGFDWFGVAGAVLLLLSVATIRFVWTWRPVLAALSYGAYAVVGFFTLRFALTEMSDHGDNRLLALALFIATTGLLAVVASFVGSRELPEPSRRPPPHTP